ncbi:3765_t:CDS:2, partial [Diversispora eburnea]
NIDETPVFFDMVGNTTIEVKGSKTVKIQITGNDKNRGLLKKKSLLILNSFEVYKTPQVKFAFKDENSNLACQWMAVGNFDLTKGDNIKKPGYNVIYHMIYESDGENNYKANYDREVILKDDISAYDSDIEDNENNILSD